MKLGQDCYIVRDADGHALAYVYFGDEPGSRAAGEAPALRAKILADRDGNRTKLRAFSVRLASKSGVGFQHHRRRRYG